MGNTAAGSAGPDRIVAALVIRAGRVLLCHRTADRRWYPDVWDLAGGHVEAGETPARALVRELREELGVIITEPSGPEWARVITADFDMRIWLVVAWTGDLTNGAPAEHDHIRWFGAPELTGLRLAHDSYVSLITRALGDQDHQG